VEKGTLASIQLDKQFIISLVELLAICGAGENRQVHTGAALLCASLLHAAQRHSLLWWLALVACASGLLQ
jgi:hypothetical protein